MIERLFDSPTMNILRNALAASSLTHKVIAHNLANVDTPGFKRSEVLFADRLAAALAGQEAARDQLKGARTNARHLPIGQVPDPADVTAEVVTRAETSLRPDGNNVDLDAEMVKLSQNTVLYQALTQLVRDRLTSLRRVISENPSQGG